MSPVSPLSSTSRCPPRPRCPQCPLCPLSSRAPAVSRAPPGLALPAGMSPAVPKDPSVSPGVTPAVSPLPRSVTRVGRGQSRATSAPRAFPLCVPNNGSATCWGPCPLPGDSAGTRGQGGHGAAARRLLRAGMALAGGLLCGASGLALLVAATATHFWAQRRTPGGTATLGLWHGCLGGQCHPHATTPALLEAARVLMLLSVVAAAAGLALGLAVGTGGGHRTRARVAGATLLLAGLLALLGLGLCSGGALALLGPLRSSWSFSWSYMLGWAAAVLLGSAGIFHLCAASKDPSPESSEVGGS